MLSKKPPKTHTKQENQYKRLDIKFEGFSLINDFFKISTGHGVLIVGLI